MPCDKIQEFILTDYLDNEVNADQRKSVDDHVSSCHVCHEFLINAQKSVIEPLEDLPKAEVPGEIWQNIKEEISNSRQVSINGLLADFIDGLKGLMVFPKPVLAFASVAIIAMVVTVFAPDRGEKMITAQIDVQEQVQYVASLLDEVDEFDVDVYGADIEAYFL